MSIIELIDASYRYSYDAPWAIKNANLSVARGSFVGVIGPTGAGKSTLLNLISGAVPHFFRSGQLEGEVRLDEQKVGDQLFADLSSRIGTILQDPEAQIFNLFVEEELTWGAQNLGLSAEGIRQRMEIIHPEFELTHLMKRRTPTLSGGEKQKLTLAAMLMMSPEILLLDEPTSELDSRGTEMFFEYVSELAKSGITILLAEHKIEYLVRHADWIIVLNEGQIVLEGSPREVFMQESVLNACGYVPPHVMTLYRRINARCDSDFPLPTTVDEAVRLSRSFLPQKGSVGGEDESDSRLGPETSMVEQAAPPPIEARDLWFAYPEPNFVQALSGINLTITKGEFLAVIGRNGSGKTTLIKQFIGLLRPTRGAVLVDGKDIHDLLTSELARNVGYVFQNPDRQIFHDQVIDEVAYGPRNLGLDKEAAQQRSLEVLASLDMADLAYHNCFTLGRGQRQRVAVASILAMDPKVILIDEPTTGQDPSGARSIMDLLRDLNERGHTIVAITHDMSLVAEYARRVVALLDGRILADGPTHEVFADPELLELTSIRVPQITQFSLATEQPIFLSVDEAVNALSSYVCGRGPSSR